MNKRDHITHGGRKAGVYHNNGKPIKLNQKPKEPTFTEKKRNESGYAQKLKNRFKP